MAVIRIDWIVCRGREREVLDSRVECPAAKWPGLRRKRVENCLDCRHLIATSIDRLPEEMCSAAGLTPLRSPVQNLL